MNESVWRTDDSGYKKNSPLEGGQLYDFINKTGIKMSKFISVNGQLWGPGLEDYYTIS